ncbi:TetR/AcrR family transcriptional regulator [Amycolatopsis nigrescens]|uniref:TetR/AcrR family transcriptional regulator n=1 Tax=Amycolatopsis nigrescens TaxID=381445 RepID=UPI000372787F|nr:TetR/AcrR family transcriptional regulator [Amycolatopsis nigrescens]
MARTTDDRIARIGDAAIEVIAEDGMRGLTHRAVDRAAELPAGSTSYYARTRQALLELAIGRIVELDVAAPESPAEPADLDALAGYLAGFLHATITTGKRRMLARYEFALEATRRPELREPYDRGGSLLRARCAELLRTAGSADPERHARLVIAWLDGLIFDSIAGTGSRRPPDKAELETGIHELLSVLLPTSS